MQKPQIHTTSFAAPVLVPQAPKPAPPKPERQPTRFRAFICPANDTAFHIAEWAIELRQAGKDWTGSISSENPEMQLQAPGMGTDFHVTLTVWGRYGEKIPTVALSCKEQGHYAEVRHEAAIGIVANQCGTEVAFWIASDIFRSEG